MASSIRIELEPLGKTLIVAPGASLQDSLFSQGVEFPCGGKGRCKGCRIRLREGHLPVTSDDARLLTPVELAQGWRLACRARAESDLKIELAQWEASILSDDTHVPFVPRRGLGVAVDLGTTTIVGQLLDLSTGRVLGVATALNSQAQHGADIMSRIEFALTGGGAALLRNLVRVQIGELIAGLVREAGASGAELTEVVLVGNTVMHHLFIGIDVEPLAHFPFEPRNDGLAVFDSRDLGWSWTPDFSSGAWRDTPGPRVTFLPCLGGFVGSDLLAGILATGVHESEDLVGLIDLGTNGEIVLGNRKQILCASTAAGPAFEGARISAGMRAATGAIAEVNLRDNQVECRVLGNGEARGICGSGLVDAVAVGLESGSILASGKLRHGRTWPLTTRVAIDQKDIRELQLAKGAIAAGIRIVLGQLGASLKDVARVYLAGAFGNYVSRTSARRIGLLHFPLEVVEPAGNTALRGAKLALFSLPNQDASHASLRAKIRHVPLSADPQFEEIFVEEMGMGD